MDLIIRSILNANEMKLVVSNLNIDYTYWIVGRRIAFVNAALNLRVP